MYDFGSMDLEGAGSTGQDHSLTSLDIPRTSTSNSSPSFFDQGDSHVSKSTNRGSKFPPALSASSPSTSIFEFPSLDELDSLGCDLLSGFWDEDQVQNTLNSSGCGAGALNFTFGKPADVSSGSSTFALKSPLPYTSKAPTLTELNMEDSLDSLFSLKPESSSVSNPKATPTTAAKPPALRMPGTPENRWRVIRDEHSGLSISPTTWSSVKHSRELSNTGLYVSSKEDKTAEVIQGGTSPSQERPKVISTERRGRPSQRLTSIKTEPGTVDFANLFGRRSRKPNAGTPGRKPLPISISSLRLQDDRKKTPASPTTKLKQEAQKSNKRLIVSSQDGFPNKHLHKEADEDDDGAESHDEGLGSENEEEHHEFNEDDDEDLADDASDISEEIAPESLSLDPSNVAGSSQVRSRRSEYDDFTPNSEKLLFIGRELQKLNNTIHDMKPTGDPSGMTKNKTRREKNKLASRACRLKKKAQHEANKLKLRALRDEDDSLAEAITQVRSSLKSYHESPSRVDSKLLGSKIEQLIDQTLAKQPIAGQTDSFVNLVLDRTAHGQPTGLDEMLQKMGDENN